MRRRLLLNAVRPLCLSCGAPTAAKCFQASLPLLPRTSWSLHAPSLSCFKHVRASMHSHLKQVPCSRYAPTCSGPCAVVTPSGISAPENSSRCSDQLVMVLTLFCSLAPVVAYFAIFPSQLDSAAIHMWHHLATLPARSAQCLFRLSLRDQVFCSNYLQQQLHHSTGPSSTCSWHGLWSAFVTFSTVHVGEIRHLVTLGTSTIMSM